VTTAVNVAYELLSRSNRPKREREKSEGKKMGVAVHM